MKATIDAARARRYLLGQASEDECSAIEAEYLERSEAVDRIAAAEDDLIEEYVAGDLKPAERAQFEQTYLAVPHRRVRVDTVRRLMARSAQSAARAEAPRSSRWVTSSRPWLALAAMLVLIASLALWQMARTKRQPEQVATNPPTAQPTTPVSPGQATPASPAPPTTPRIFAVTVSPLVVRGTSNPASAVIPPDVDVVAVRLEREADNRRLVATRGTIRTVSGQEVWQGAVAMRADLPSDIVAQLDVPATALPADDYFVTLFGTAVNGVEQEWTQYVLRVRTQ